MRASILAVGSFGSAGAQSPLDEATTLTVTSSSDDVNGDVSSAASLIANPGPDGISLREAITATNATPGGQTVSITFAPAMAGQTISFGSLLPGVRRDHVMIIGLLSAEGQPSVTIDARQATSSPHGADSILLVQASHVIITQLRFTGVAWKELGHAIWINFCCNSPQLISDVRIEDNVFDNTGFDFPRGGPRAGGIEILMGANRHVTRVTITRNAFLNYTGDGHAVGVVMGGDASSVTELTVRENRFERTDCCAIELGAYGKGGRLSGTRIVGNTFTQNSQAIDLNIGGSDTVFEDTLIAGNVVTASGVGTINISAGGPASTGNVIRQTRIVNNVVAEAPNIGIGLIGGSGPATRNRIEGVELWNNTIVSTTPSGLVSVRPNLDGAAGNTINGIVIANSIFRAPGDNFDGEVTPDMVRHSLTTMPGFTGVNGNISADPRFVDPAGGDFRLQPGSPAIDAGTSDGGYATDLDCRIRIDDPAVPNLGSGTLPWFDIGALEYLGDEGIALLLDSAGGGGVDTLPAGARCLTDGALRFPLGTAVNLSPLPQIGWRFSRWTGDEDCQDGRVILDHSVSCTAVFEPSRRRAARHP